MSAKPQSDAPIRLAAASVVNALFVQSVKTKEETSSIAGKFGERVKAQIENGNLHGAAFNQAAAIYRKGRNNEIKAKEHLSHLKYYIELLESEWENKGHVGHLDDQAKQAAAEAAAEPQSAAAAAEALFKKQDEETEATRTAAREALDLPADGAAAAPPPADAFEKPKRGRKAKQVDAAEEAAPPPPPAAVPTLADDDDDDIRPGFLKAKGAEREAAAVH